MRCFGGRFSVRTFSFEVYVVVLVMCLICKRLRKPRCDRTRSERVRCGVACVFVVVMRRIVAGVEYVVVKDNATYGNKVRDETNQCIVCDGIKFTAPFVNYC